MVAHAFSPSPLEIKAGGSQFKASLLYTANSRTARAAEGKPCFNTCTKDLQLVVGPQVPISHPCWNLGGLDLVQATEAAVNLYVCAVVLSEDTVLSQSSGS